MFKKLKKIFLSEIGDSSEVKSPNTPVDSAGLDLLSVVKIVEHGMFFKTERIHPTGFKLPQLLPSTDTVDFDLGEGHKSDIGEITITEECLAEAGLKAEITHVVDVDGKFGSSEKLSTTPIKLELVSANLQDVGLMMRQCMLDKDHMLMQDMENSQNIQGLGVIWEVIRTENPVTLEQQTTGTIKGKITGIIQSVLNIKPSVDIEQGKTKKLMLPIGCILGFRIHRLRLKTTEGPPVYQMPASGPPAYSMAASGPPAYSMVASGAAMNTIVTHQRLSLTVDTKLAEGTPIYGSSSIMAAPGPPAYKMTASGPPAYSIAACERQTLIYDDISLVEKEVVMAEVEEENLEEIKEISEESWPSENLGSADMSEEMAKERQTLMSDDIGLLEMEVEMAKGMAEFARWHTLEFLQWFVETVLCDFGKVNQSMMELTWDNLHKTLKHPQALYALECMLVEGNVSTDSYYLQELPDDARLRFQDLLRVMGLDSVESSDPHNLLKPIGFLVSALSELDEETVTLIVDLDGEVRAQVLKLVEGAMRQVCNWVAGMDRIRWRGELSESAMMIAYEVLASCGLTFSQDRPDPSLGSQGAPDEALLDLYIALKGLDMLLGP